LKLKNITEGSSQIRVSQKQLDSFVEHLKYFRHWWLFVVVGLCFCVDVGFCQLLEVVKEEGRQAEEEGRREEE
jgi:hypothetical protein